MPDTREIFTRRPHAAMQNRVIILFVAMSALGLGVWLTLSSLSSNLSYYRTPAQIHALGLPAGEPMRLGGYVAIDSVRRAGEQVEFEITDFTHAVTVFYRGVLPDLFREGQGVIVEGALDQQGRFIAGTVLAKHDENYVAPAGYGGYGEK